MESSEVKREGDRKIKLNGIRKKTLEAGQNTVWSLTYGNQDPLVFSQRILFLASFTFLYSVSLPLQTLNEGRGHMNPPPDVAAHMRLLIP